MKKNKSTSDAADDALKQMLSTAPPKPQWKPNHRKYKVEKKDNSISHTDIYIATVVVISILAISGFIFFYFTFMQSDPVKVITQ